MVLKERKVYIPKNKELRLEIIWLHHDILDIENNRDNRDGNKKLLVVKSTV